MYVLVDQQQLVMPESVTDYLVTSDQQHLVSQDCMSDYLVLCVQSPHDHLTITWSLSDYVVMYLTASWSWATAWAGACNHLVTALPVVSRPPLDHVPLSYPWHCTSPVPWTSHTPLRRRSETGRLLHRMAY